MLLHSDGFDSHATGAATLADGDPAWGAQTGVSITAASGKFSGKSLRLAAAAAGGIAFSAPGVNVGIGAYFNVATSSNPLTLIRDLGNSQNLLVRSADGTLTVRDGAGTVRVTSDPAASADGSYNWVEVHWKSDGVYLYVDGLIVDSYLGAYTSPDFSDLRLLDSAGTGIGQVDVDDLVVWDDQGSYMNSFPLGPRRIQLHRPTAAGASTQWTPASGANWQAVDDTDWSGGVGVTAETASLKDLYELSDLTVNPATINAVVVRTKVQNTGDNPAQLQHVLRGSDGSEVNGTLQAVPTLAPTVLKSAFYRDTNGAPWTPATVNALQAGQVSSN